MRPSGETAILVKIGGFHLKSPYIALNPSCQDLKCGRTCVVCDQLKNTRTHAHRTPVLEVFLHAHVRPHIARVRERTHLRNSPLDS